MYDISQEYVTTRLPECGDTVQAQTKQILAQIWSPRPYAKSLLYTSLVCVHEVISFVLCYMSSLQDPGTDLVLSVHITRLLSLLHV